MSLFVFFHSLFSYTVTEEKDSNICSADLKLSVRSSGALDCQQKWDPEHQNTVTLSGRVRAVQAMNQDQGFGDEHTHDRNAMMPVRLSQDA
ncbi:unnamed protein product [Hydatigera taeniaeformis]|uniref:BON domain-containing protein n=1 Tax=Hydatigena taeniaeformis TaxID=6205 RepID=A0A0R3WT45_HYDTA|nr:unnamed protein product [Hydatigera taeniaeformis]